MEPEKTPLKVCFVGDDSKPGEEHYLDIDKEQAKKIPCLHDHAESMMQKAVGKGLQHLVTNALKSAGLQKAKEESDSDSDISDHDTRYDRADLLA
jgi:hypothetical protein